MSIDFQEIFEIHYSTNFLENVWAIIFFNLNVVVIQKNNCWKIFEL